MRKIGTLISSFYNKEINMSLTVCPFLVLCTVKRKVGTIVKQVFHCQGEVRTLTSSLPFNLGACGFTSRARKKSSLHRPVIRPFSSSCRAGPCTTTQLWPIYHSALCILIKIIYLSKQSKVTFTLK